MATVEEHIAAWSDVISLVLVSVAFLIGGVDPRRHVWGRGILRNTFLAIFMLLNVVFSGARLIYEGITVEPGPREFLLASVVYSARWLWLFTSITRSGTRSAKAVKVARVLKDLKTIRLGKSTLPERQGETELVLRRGARVVHGEIYWRGVQEYYKYHEPVDTHFVMLVEQELHSNMLDEIGTVKFKRQLETESNDGLYKKFYNLVMTVDAQNSNLVVNYDQFLTKYGHVARTTRQAQRVEATGDSKLADIARRVAADACYYIWFPDATFRTRDQVDIINECLETAANNHLGIGSDNNV